MNGNPDTRVKLGSDTKSLQDCLYRGAGKRSGMGLRRHSDLQSVFTKL